MKPTHFEFEVLANRWMTPTVFSLEFRPLASSPDQLVFVAGQFVSVIIPGAGPKGRDLRRAYSIASPPEFDHLELCVKLVEGGPGTQYLSKLKPGDHFKGTAPFGEFVYKTQTQRHAYFIATGTGLAPFRAMVLSKPFKENQPRSATCLFGVGKEAELLYSDELKKIPNLKWIPCLSRPDQPWAGITGRVTHYLREVDNDYPWQDADYYLCGNGEMIKEVRSFLESKGVDKKSVFMEKYY